MVACSHVCCDVLTAQPCSTAAFACHMCTIRVDSDRAEESQSWRICAQCALTNPIEVISLFRAPYSNTPYCRKKRLLSTPHAVTLAARWIRRNPVPPRIARALDAICAPTGSIRIVPRIFNHGAYVHSVRRLIQSRLFPSFAPRIIILLTAGRRGCFRRRMQSR